MISQEGTEVPTRHGSRQDSPMGDVAISVKVYSQRRNRLQIIRPNVFDTC